MTYRYIASLPSTCVGLRCYTGNLWKWLTYVSVPNNRVVGHYWSNMWCDNTQQSATIYVAIRINHSSEAFFKNCGCVTFFHVHHGTSNTTQLWTHQDYRRASHLQSVCYLQKPKSWNRCLAAYRAATHRRNDRRLSTWKFPCHVCALFAKCRYNCTQVSVKRRQYAKKKKKAKNMYGTTPIFVWILYQPMAMSVVVLPRSHVNLPSAGVLFFTWTMCLIYIEYIWDEE